MFGALQLGLGLTRGNGGGMPWYPHRLFQSGDILLWYDPSDLGTMFQDVTGAATVTADGQSVALHLDKGQWGGKTLAQVIAAQTEIFPQPGFDASAGLTLDANWSVGSGVATSNGSNGFITATGTLTSGKTYYFSIEIKSRSAGVVYCYDGTGGNIRAMSTVGVHTGVFVAASPSVFIFSSAFNGTIDNVSIKEIPGRTRRQATGTSMPKYKTDNTLHWLLYDGTDDSYQTPTITWGTDEVAACVGLTKSSDAAGGAVFEFSPTSSSNNGSFALLAPSSAAANLFFRSKGSAASDQTRTTYTAPITAVLTGLGKIATDVNRFRINADEATSSDDQGAGNFGSYVMNFGRRNNTSLPLNGKEFQTVLRSRLFSASELANIETFVAAKSGVTL